MPKKKNEDYGTQSVTPKALAWFSSVQKADEYASEKQDTRVLKVKVNTDNPEHKKFLNKLTDFENERRRAHGKDEAAMTTALKSRKDKQTGETVTFIQAKTSQVDTLTILDMDGKPTDREVWMDDEVIAVVVPKFNPDSFGKPTLALYLNGVRFCSERRGGMSTVELLGGDVSLTDDTEGDISLGESEEEVVNLASLDVG